jgi:hypothetical protein
MGVDTEALMIFGWIISYKEAKALFEHCDVRKEGSYIDDFVINGRWSVIGYSWTYDCQTEHLRYYIVWKSWSDNHSYEGVSLSSLEPPDEASVFMLQEFLKTIKMDSEEDKKELLDHITLSNIRLYPQVYEH